MSQFIKPSAPKALRGKARPNLNATISAPNSPKALTSRRTMAPGSLSTSCASTSAPSSLNVTMRSTSKSSKKTKPDPVRLAYIEYLIARAMNSAVEIESDKRAEELTKKLILLEINDDETYATLNEYEMKIKEAKAFVEAKMKFLKQIEKINDELELKDEVMETLERIQGKLQSMDKLTVINIETHEEEWIVLKDLIEECDQVMDSITNDYRDFDLTLELKKNLDEFINLLTAVFKQLHIIRGELELLEADTVITLGSKIK
ncbi:GSCOCG00007031001-RA-CDS [Cotesia congregata]|nr:GSCOCG00007031001-RA-CDS [Cotesia congregata]